MTDAYTRRNERVAQAGADILRISETSVLVIADDFECEGPWCHPAWALCRGLGALGFGEIRLRGCDAFFHEFARMMEGFPFDHGASLRPLRASWAESSAREMILHLGNDPGSRSDAAELALSRSSHLVSVSWGSTWVAMETLASLVAGGTRNRSATMHQQPLPPIGRIAAGLALQEALIVAGELGAATPADSIISFDAAAETRTREGHEAAWPAVRLESAIVEVIGAGAVGVHLLESLVPMLEHTCELRIVDFDEVNPENLAMQPAFTPDDVGRPKATVMAEKLAKLARPGLDLRPLVMRFEDLPGNLALPSLRIACPDSFAARKAVNDRSIRQGVPLVEAGSSPLVAQERTYLPGITACIEHRIPNLADRAARERDRASCSEEQAFTLPGTNMICAGILGVEALRALHPESLGLPSPGIIVYDARAPRRFGVTDFRPACRHPVETDFHESV